MKITLMLLSVFLITLQAHANEVQLAPKEAHQELLEYLTPEEFSTEQRDRVENCDDQPIGACSLSVKPVDNFGNCPSGHSKVTNYHCNGTTSQNCHRCAGYCPIGSSCTRKRVRLNCPPGSAQQTYFVSQCYCPNPR